MALSLRAISSLSSLSLLPSSKQPYRYRSLAYIAIIASVLFVLCRLYLFPDDDLLALGSLHDSPERHALCAAHGFAPYPSGGDGTARRKIYDITMVNTELDWLEIRLDALYDEVDLFIIVESPTTFHGHAKPMLAKESWHRFARYHDKMLHHELEFPSGFRPRRTWDFERLQRDAGYEQVFPKLISGGDRAPRLGDVLVVADVDEIPRPETLRVLRACAFPRRLTLASRFYYYSFQFLSVGPEWHHPQATFYDGPGARTLAPNDLRDGQGGNFVSRWRESARYGNASWHCSSCFDSMDMFLNKMASFSHKWMNGAQYRDRDRIADAVRDGVDIWGRRSSTFERLDGNQDLPPLVRDDPRYVYLRDRSGKSAGMKDYP
ncbi:glycosyl transferase family 17 protein [Cordyceps fumosorosea ARSEF 2679]|uniref:Glycosyl transferase family 17 protein n=1 Tax=Cordyceps fumosorosea (strain ARSEF 2679) TaxID=1081104 RepID=A0A167V846_CORFA|nr:glycosyl transferase family 17 protein [Cordyceps fumosorosea ARSEF 2679]OAA62333.1 glycosyl transferase family 17 protein [Cordyceps fumosorosea ARSEF 2679]